MKTVRANILVTIEFKDHDSEDDLQKIMKEALRRGRMLEPRGPNTYMRRTNIEGVHLVDISVPSVTGNIEECWGCAKPINEGDYFTTVEISKMVRGLPTPLPDSVEGPGHHELESATYHIFCMECTLRQGLIDRDSIEQCNPEVTLPEVSEEEELDPDFDGDEDLEVFDDREDYNSRGDYAQE
jgi:hypothetical protein